MNKPLSLIAGALLAGLGLGVQAAPGERAVIEHYADLAHAIYHDSLTTAKALNQAVDTLIVAPTEAHLDAARAAWKAARVPYQQSEVYRFGNPIVDDWEGKVNAWPLDEGLIDYVAAMERHAVPAYQRLAGATAELEGRLHAFCRALGAAGLESARDGFHRAMDAWQGVQHIRFGPVERFLRYHRFQMWPDKHNTGAKQLRKLLAAEDREALGGERFRAPAWRCRG